MEGSVNEWLSPACAQENTLGGFEAQKLHIGQRAIVVTVGTRRSVKPTRGPCKSKIVNWRADQVLCGIGAVRWCAAAAERGSPVARITQVVVTCDLEDGDVSASDSLTFSYNGKNYTLDLCKEHLNEVKGVLETYATAGHSAGRGGRGRRRGAAPAGRAPRASRAAAPRGESQAEIREWARAQGYAVGDRGRIPAEVRAAYEASQAKGGRRR